MSNLNLHKTNITTPKGHSTQLVYDLDEDNLEIFFGDNENATGIELTEHILLRLNLQNVRPVSLNFFHFSILSEITEYGPRSYPLNLEEIPDDIKNVVSRIILVPPVSEFLSVVHFQASPIKQVPITYIIPPIELTNHLTSPAT